MLLSTVKHLTRAFGFTVDGLKYAYQNEFAFRLECYLTPLALLLAVYIGGNAIAVAMLLGSWFLVPIVELLNSAVEAAIDRIGEERHPLSKAAKDLGSAAVFLACVNAGCVWLLLLFFQ